MNFKILFPTLALSAAAVASAQGYAKSHQPSLKTAESVASHQAKAKVTKCAKVVAQKITKIGDGLYEVVDKNGVKSTFKVTERGKKGVIVWRRDPKTGKMVKEDVKQANQKAKH